MKTYPVRSEKIQMIESGGKFGAVIIEGHVQGLSNTRSLGESGIQVIVVDTKNCIARYSKYCKGFFKCPPFNNNGLADFLINLAQEKQLKGWLLLPSNDHAVITISRNKNRLEKYFKVCTADFKIIENIYDKSRLLSLAQKINVPVPVTVSYFDILSKTTELSYPLLIKGRFGLDFYKATGKKVFLVNSSKELFKRFESISKCIAEDKVIIQEVIPFNGLNRTISFTAFCENGEIKTYWIGEKLREHPFRFGTATFARSTYIEECYTQSIPLLKTLEYTGICEVEYIKDPRDKSYKLIEINARTWLWVGLAKDCGVDYAKMIYDYMTGVKIAYPTKYKEINTGLIHSVILFMHLTLF